MDDRALVAHEPVEQGRLADVRAADDRDGEDAVVGLRHPRPRSAGRLGQRTTRRVEEVAAAAPVHGRHRVRVAEAELGELPDSASRRSSSTLLTTTSTGFSLRCSTRATCASSSVTPTVTSTTSRITSASAMARSACELTCAASAGPRRRRRGRRLSQPPVSTTMNSRPFHSASSILRSRVTPGFSSTIASRRPDEPVDQRRLADVGTADDGDDGQGGVRRPHRARRATRRRWPRPRPGGAGRRGWCRRGSGRSRARRRGAGSARPTGAASRTRRDVGPGEQSGDGDVAAEEAVLDRRARGSGTSAAAARSSATGASTRAPYSPVRIVIGALAGGGVDRPQGDAGRAVALGRRPVDPGEEPGAGAVGRHVGAGELGLHLAGELGRHADAVLVLREVVVGLERGERPVGEQVVLVGGVHEPAAQRGQEALLPRGRPCRSRARPRPGCAAASPVRWCASLTPSGTTPTVASAGNRSSTPSSVSSSASPSLMPGHTTIWPCTSMPASSSSAEPPQARRAAAVAQQPGAQLGVGGVDADVQRAQPLGDHTLEVGLGEAGERGEVAVEEREPVVVVLQREALPHPLRQLVDEAERAVVVAGAHPVEHRARRARGRAARPRLSRRARAARDRRDGPRARRAARRPGAGTG